MGRIERLLILVCEEQDVVTRNMGHNNAPVAIGAQGRRDALRRQIAERDRVLVKALERITETCDSWEGRDDPPWWNLGDIARAALARAKGE